jgi:hypothetical protein
MQTVERSPGTDSHEQIGAGPGHPTTQAIPMQKQHTSRRGYCPSCQQDVAAVMKRRFVGIRNGGMQLQSVCPACGRVLQDF